MAVCLCLVTVCSVAAPARADDDPMQRLLDLITATAAKICQSVPLSSTNTGVALSGDAKATLNGVVSRFVDLGVNGAAQYQSRESMGVLQEELASAISHGNDCRLSVFNTLERDLIQSSAAIRKAPSRSVPNGFAQQPIQPPASQQQNAPPARAPAVVGAGPAYALAGQRWEFDIDGQPLRIVFLKGDRAQLSDDRFGTDATWQPMSSISYQVRTDTGVSIFGWFQQDGNASVTGCGMTIRTPSRAVMANSNQPMTFPRCRLLN